MVYVLLLPILFVLVPEAARIVLPELLGGDPLRPEATVVEDVGTDPSEVHPDRDGPPTGDSTLTETRSPRRTDAGTGRL
ncbi:hypothetical protein [Halorarius litoreus]|uniref:hypothetical protein n=1 Tax=Halorarius litoreus TaxID=2962676 RepID=UPI0020CD9B90|nr:hypothetical protein [Halorarius litoreus]